MLDGVRYRPIYNGYMKVSIPMAITLFISSQSNCRSNPCTTASLALFIRELLNDFLHRSLLFLWWFPLNLQCLHVRSFNVTILFMWLTFPTTGSLVFRGSFLASLLLQALSDAVATVLAPQD
jgi:hypothetical protein